MTKMHISHKTDEYVISRKVKGDHGEYEQTEMKIKHEKKIKNGELYKEEFKIIPELKRCSGDSIRLSKKNAMRLVEKLSEIMEENNE